jgi:hypothetical protein
MLLGIPEEQDFIKSFREGSKVLIARTGGNRAGRFLEATTFGLGGRKGFIFIPEGRGRRGWQNFSGELSKAVDFLSATVGTGLGSSSSLTKKDAKVLGPSLGLVSKWTGPSFAEVLCSVPSTAVKKLPFVGDHRSGLRASSEEPDALVPLPATSHAEQVLSSAVGCFALESRPSDLLVKDRSFESLGKKPSPSSNSNFEFSMLRTWSKLVNDLKVVLGRAIKNFLGRFVGFGLGRKRSGFRLARLLPKPKSRSPRILPELTPESFSGLSLIRPPPGGLVVPSSGEGLVAPGASPFPAPSLALLWPEPSSPAVPGASPVRTSSPGISLDRHPPGGLGIPSPGEDFAAPGVSPALPAPVPAVPGVFLVQFSLLGGGSSCLKVVPSRVTAPKLFGFPPSPAQVSLPPVVQVVSLPAQVSPPLRCNPDGASRTVSQLTSPTSIGATKLGEKLRSSFPVVSKPFQSYIKKARILREGFR